MFPTLKKKRWGRNVSFDRYAQAWLPRQYGKCPNPSPLYTNPRVSLKMKVDLHRDLGVDCSWGGLWEDRSCMWAGGYMEESRAFIHLGVDYTVPAHTPVCVDLPCRVVHIDTDADGSRQRGGWGRRLIVELRNEPIVLLYAHLSPVLSCEMGEMLEPGQVFGQIGNPAHNGGWSPHLHLQAMRLTSWDYYRFNLDELDGYGTKEELPVLKQRFLDPIRYVNVP